MIKNTQLSQPQSQTYQLFDNASKNWKNSIIASRTNPVVEPANPDEICPNTDTQPAPPTSRKSKKSTSLNPILDLKNRARILMDTLVISPENRAELQACLNEISELVKQSNEYKEQHKNCVSRPLLKQLLNSISKLDKLVVKIEKKLVKQHPVNV
jgi:hypothetical protein